MSCMKTSRGYIRKELTQDGRESVDKWIDRETGQRKQTKTKIKRQKKKEAELIDIIKNL